MTRRFFSAKTTIPTTLEKMAAFHAERRALQRLTPPPVFVQVKRDTRTSPQSGELEFVLWFGFIPTRWHVRHEAGPIETSFADRMLSGPMQFWYHQHIFREVEGGVELTDQIEYEYPDKGFGALFSRVTLAPIMLHILFAYRHWRTRAGTREKDG